MRLRRLLSEVPSQGEVRVGPLPWVTPMLKVQQGVIAHLVVLLDRQGADVWGIDDRGGLAVDAEVAGDDFQISLVNQGGLAHRRIHQRAVNRWEANAKEVAAKIADLVRAKPVRAVFVAGDVYAVGFFLEALPGDVAPLMYQLESGARGPESGRDGVSEEVQRLLRTIEADDTKAVLDEFDQAHGRQAGAAAGADEVVAALQMATVATLLVPEQPDDERQAWFGPDPTHLALELAELTAMGVDEADEGPLVDACIRAAFGTGAAIRVVPGHALSGGVGAILRGDHTVSR